MAFTQVCTSLARLALPWLHLLRYECFTGWRSNRHLRRRAAILACPLVEFSRLSFSSALLVLSTLPPMLQISASTIVPRARDGLLPRATPPRAPFYCRCRTYAYTFARYVLLACFRTHAHMSAPALGWR